MTDIDTFRITNVEYTHWDNKLVTHVFGRSDNGQSIHKKIEDAVPYIFVSKEEFDPSVLKRHDEIASQILDWQDGYQSYDGVDLVQVVVKEHTVVRELKNTFKTTYEGDLNFVRRCTADYSLSGYVRTPSKTNVSVTDIERIGEEEAGYIEPRGLFVDIEVIPPDHFYEEFASDAPNEVTAITAYDNYEKAYTLFCLDPDLQVEAENIRGYIESNWEGYEDYDHITNETVHFKRFGNEKNLLKAFSEYVASRDADYMTGWNYVNFDHEYLFNRMSDVIGWEIKEMSPLNWVGGYKTETYISGVPAIDMMQAYADKLVYGNLKSKKLEYVARDALGVGKISGGDNKFEGNRTKYMAYNIVDVQLCVELDRKFGVMDFWFMLADVCAIPPYDVGSAMREVDGFLFKHRESDEILPSVTEKEMNTISGGFVMPPSNGLKDWVGVLDLKSLYPSSIITCNISKETMTTDPAKADIIVPDMPLNYEQVAGNEIREQDIGWRLGEGACIGFSLEKEGIMPKYLKLLFKNREEMKQKRDEYDPGSREYDMFDMRQRAIKVVMNSFFGVSDNPYFRLSADGLGAATTSVSRFVSWVGIQIIKEQGYDVRYGDTDSLFVSLTDREGVSKTLDVDDYVDMMTALEDAINNNLHVIADRIGVPKSHPYLSDDMHGTSRHLWVYEAEKLYRRFLQTGAKKRYAGNIVWKEGKMVDDTDVSGFETVRSSSAAITQDIQQEFIERLLDGEKYDSLSEFVREYVRGVEEEEYDLEYIGFPSVLNKAIEKYPNMPVKRATLYSNEHLGYDWGVGDDPWLVYVDSVPHGLPDTDVIAVEWTDESLPNGFTIDTKHHLEKSIRKPLQAIIDGMDFTWRELKTGLKEQAIVGTGDSNEIVFNEEGGVKDPFADIE
jgi:DNA polymerase elongation subunit (family B)